MSALSRRSLIVATGSAALLTLTATEQASAAGLGAAATRTPQVRTPATATIPVGGAPHAVVVTPGHRYAYVPAVLDNAVDIIDLRTNKLTAQIPVGTAPTDVAFNHTGSLAYVTNRGSGTVSVLDTATRRVTRTIPAGEAPSSISVKAHSGDSLYAADPVGNAVLLLDAQTGKIRHQWAVEEPAAAVSTSNGYLVAPSFADGDVLIINTRTFASRHLRRPDGFGTNPGQITPAGTLVPLPGEAVNPRINWRSFHTLFGVTGRRRPTSGGLR